MMRVCLFSLWLVLAAALVAAQNSTEPQIIIGVGLPKSGSTSLNRYLNNCGAGIRSIHFTSSCVRSVYPIPAVRVNGVIWGALEVPELAGRLRGQQCTIAALFQRALADGQKPLEYVLKGNVNAVVQLDSDLGQMAVYPQIDALDIILDSYPNALYIHHIRKVTRHAASIIGWHDMAQRMQEKGTLGRFPGQNENKTIEENLIVWIETARDIVRSEFADRPEIKYLEVDIEGDAGASRKLAAFVGATKGMDVPRANARKTKP
jgi:hypothetical protein